MIAIIDYGMGNLASVQKGLARAGYPAVMTSDPQEVLQASGLVLPGVGAFEAGMRNLKQTGLIDVIKEKVKQGTPLLGICLGMQLLFEESEENGTYQGLGIFPGRVIKFKLAENLKVPHMGWNRVRKEGNCPLFQGIPSESYFYFVHSYYAAVESNNFVHGMTHYGLDFPAVVGQGQVFGVQFHPEKSSDQGMLLLKNFGELV